MTVPPVNIIKYLLGSRLRIVGDDVLDNPMNKVVFEGTFDKLM
jgi:hypothetical protein